jgi:hypothetical protein
VATTLPDGTAPQPTPAYREGVLNRCAVQRTSLTRALHGGSRAFNQALSPLTNLTLLIPPHPPALSTRWPCGGRQPVCRAGGASHHFVGGRGGATQPVEYGANFPDQTRACSHQTPASHTGAVQSNAAFSNQTLALPNQTRAFSAAGARLRDLMVHGAAGAAALPASSAGLELY